MIWLHGGDGSHLGINKRALIGRKDGFRTRGVNPDQANTEHVRTPFSWAADNGHEEIV